MSFWFAFGLTLLAGLSTGIGSLIAFVTHRSNIRFLSLALGFSAGVMIYVSLVSLLPHSIAVLAGVYRGIQAEWMTILLFFGGVLVTAGIDLIIPEIENPHDRNHDHHALTRLKKYRGHSGRLLRVGLLTAGALALHNFPEGLATFMSALSMPEIALPIALAIAIHNIPEGMAVSVPVFYATGSRQKAFVYSFLSGLAEPLGGVVGYWILYPFINPAFLGGIFAVVAGIMIYISFDELLPAAHRYSDHSAIIGLFGGMFLMAVVLTITD